jgi:hypothetical protein
LVKLARISSKRSARRSPILLFWPLVIKA